jgi:hypothetical protein
VTQLRASPERLCYARENGSNHLADGLGVPAGRAPEGVLGNWGRRIKLRSMAPSCLLPLTRADGEETLAGSRAHRGSPTMPLGGRGGNEEARRSMASSESGGMIDLDTGRWICRPAVERLARVLHGVVVSVFLGQKKGRVRLLWMVGAHACRGRGS